MVTVDCGNDAIQIDGADESIATARSVAEVERRVLIYSMAARLEVEE